MDWNLSRDTIKSFLESAGEVLAFHCRRIILRGARIVKRFVAPIDLESPKRGAVGGNALHRKDGFLTRGVDKPFAGG
jgi:hypothetical protein